MMWLLLACAGGPEDSKADPAGDTDTGDTTTDTDSGATDSGETDSGDTDTGVCAPAAVPVANNFERGYTGAEDFAFDGEGYLVSIDPLGNLVGINREGEQKTILPGATLYGAGTRFLPDGDIVFCDAGTGSLVRVAPATGASVVVLGGLEYPNGLDVDLEGMVYVAEQISGKVRRIDPVTGDYTVVAQGLYNPNGLSFSPDYQTLYVGSFGAGLVWAVDRDGDTWSTPRVYATTPEAPGVPPDWCDTGLLGDVCAMDGGYGIGICAETGGDDLHCAGALDVDACTGLVAGDACATTRFGEPLAQTCHDDGAELFCPRTDVAYTDPCVGQLDGEPCAVGEEPGACYASWEGVPGCYLASSWPGSYVDDCAARADGDPCVIDDPLYPSMGACGDGAEWGVVGLMCWPAGVIYDEHGGLDGVNVDACGDVYVTEFTLGKVWRFDAEGAEAQLVAQVRSAWIPNMHWGNGIGGWEKDVLYVMDRQRAGLFALEVGVEGHADAYQPVAPE
ncbi:MAG: SMP-30/gluconolactonase/LRE family protein [Pseudomonadota bacterium]|nr:SMP-30/gluconolactonase/LRE family protein [Pseudomonadota bacterium]